MKIITGLLLIIIASLFIFIIPYYIAVSQNSYWLDYVINSHGTEISKIIQYNNTVLFWKTNLLIIFKMIIYYLVTVIFINMTRNKIVGTILGAFTFLSPVYLLNIFFTTTAASRTIKFIYNLFHKIEISNRNLDFICSRYYNSAESIVQFIMPNTQAKTSIFDYRYVTKIDGSYAQSTEIISLTETKGINFYLIFLFVLIIGIYFLAKKVYCDGNNISKTNLFCYKSGEIILGIIIFFMVCGTFLGMSSSLYNINILFFMIPAIIISFVIIHLILKFTSEKERRIN